VKLFDGSGHSLRCGQLLLQQLTLVQPCVLAVKRQ
jgi:hypothetical protein